MEAELSSATYIDKYFLRAKRLLWRLSGLRNRKSRTVSSIALLKIIRRSTTITWPNYNKRASNKILFFELKVRYLKFRSRYFSKTVTSNITFCVADSTPNGFLSAHVPTGGSHWRIWAVSFFSSMLKLEGQVGGGVFCKDLSVKLT